MLFQLVETDGPVFDDVLLVQLFLDDDLEQSGGKRAVAARPGPDPQVGEPGRVGLLRIDGDQLATGLEELFQGLPPEAAGGLVHVAAPHHDQRGQVIVVAYDRRSIGERAGHRLRDPAGPSRGDHAGRAERARQALREREFHAFGLPQSESHGFGAELLFHVVEFRRDGVQRLIPGNALPLAFAARTDSLLRIQQPVLVAQHLRDREASLVQRALLGVQPAFHVRFQIDQFAVLDDGLHAAMTGAQVAEGEDLGTGLGAGGGGRARVPGTPCTLVGMDEGLHQRTESGFSGGQFLHRDDVFAVGIHGQQQAGADQLAVHGNGARPAFADAASLLGLRQPEILDQHLQERAPRIDRDIPGFAVHVHSDFVFRSGVHAHALLSSCPGAGDNAFQPLADQHRDEFPPVPRVAAEIVDGERLLCGHPRDFFQQFDFARTAG